MSGVRARFFVQSVEMTPHQVGGGKVKLAPVSRGERNKEWSAATPSGEMWMYVSNPAGFEFFADIVRRCQAGELKYPEVDITMVVADQEA